MGQGDSITFAAGCAIEYVAKIASVRHGAWVITIVGSGSVTVGNADWSFAGLANALRCRAVPATGGGALALGVANQNIAWIARVGDCARIAARRKGYVAVVEVTRRRTRNTVA